MAHQIPVADVAATFTFETRDGWEREKTIAPERREMDVFVLSLSPSDVHQRLEDAWMEAALAELGLIDLVPHG